MPVRHRSHPRQSTTRSPTPTAGAARCGSSTCRSPGADPDTGFARPGYDNEGIQYGLDALNAGVITPDQFVDLNAEHRRLRRRRRPAPERSVVDADLAQRAYETGRCRPERRPARHADDPGQRVHRRGGRHPRPGAVVLALDRLAGEDGEARTASRCGPSACPGAGLTDTLTGALGDFAAEPTLALDEWLTAAEAHQADEGGSWQDALAATKPDTARSRSRPDRGAEIEGDDANDDPAARRRSRSTRTPHAVAGAPPGRRPEVRARPVEEATDLYEVDLTDAQLDRLAEVFPPGLRLAAAESGAPAFD